LGVEHCIFKMHKLCMALMDYGQRVMLLHVMVANHMGMAALCHGIMLAWRVQMLCTIACLG
jgi:hypothetical protein